MIYYTTLFRNLFLHLKTTILEEMAPSMAASEDNWLDYPGGDRVTILSDTTIDDFISANPLAMIMFYAKWCGHCKSAKPEYAKAAQILAKREPGAALGAIDCQIYRNINTKFKISGYPTFNYYKNGKQLGEYMDSRRGTDIAAFMLKL